MFRREVDGWHEACPEDQLMIRMRKFESSELA